MLMELLFCFVLNSCWSDLRSAVQSISLSAFPLSPDLVFGM